MTKKQKMSKGMPFKGYRYGVSPKVKVNLKALEKCTVLTSLQHDLVKSMFDKCTKEVKDEEGNVTETKLLTSLKHRQRLEKLVDKDYNEAMVDGKGNYWEKPRALSKEEIDKMNRDAVEQGKKGYSKKDLEKGNEK